MKLLFVSPFPLFPATGGNRVRTLQMIEACRSLGHDIGFIFMPSRQMGSVDLAAHNEFLGDGRFHCLRRGMFDEAVYYSARIAFKLFRKLSGSNLRLSRVDETYFDGFTSQIRKIDKFFKCDALIAQYVTFSAVFEALDSDALKIIDTHDRFQDALPRSEEQKGLARADRIMAIQEREAGYFAELLEDADHSIFVVSHIIQKSKPVELSACSGATFIGSDFHQNVVSLMWFIEEVLPIILADAPEFTLYVAGTICRSIPEAPGVKKIGVVPFFGDAFRDAPILVNSITEGTGIKIKLLEAFGHGIPAVSTQLGVEGISSADLDGVHVTRDGDAAGFARAVLRLYQDTDERIVRGNASFATAGSWNRRQLSSLVECLQP